MSHIRRVVIEEIRGKRFKIDGSLGRENNEVELRRINVLTGCNGSFKTSILEALTASLLTLTSPSYAKSLAYVAATLRMDELWLYKLLRDGFKLMVDDITIKTISEPSTKAVIIAEDSYRKRSLSRLEVIRKTSTSWSSWYRYNRYNISINVEKIDYSINYDFIALSMPNLLTQRFVNSFIKLISSKSNLYLFLLDKFGKVFEDFEIYFYRFEQDEFNRRSIIFAVKNDGGAMKIPIQYLGSGYLGLALMTLAASKDIVIYDNVESRMHPRLMYRAAELMSDAKNVQWIITTQSSEMLEAILNNVDLNELLVIETSTKGLLRVYDGDEANRRVKKLDEDLRGSCL